jgi:regulator of sigma E protease
MLDALYTVTAFIVAIGVLVTVHEFGHFWVARKLGVKVLRFSVGFGRPLYLRRFGQDQTEFVIAAIPLGGYVKMLGEHDLDEVSAADRNRAFQAKSVWVRIAVVAAGPVFNLIFAIVAFWLMYMVGVTGIKPLVGAVEPGSPAWEAGVEAGDEIMAVAGEATPTWKRALMGIYEAALDGREVDVEVQTGGGELRLRRLDLGEGAARQDPEELLRSLGLKPEQVDYPAVFAAIVDGSAASRAGLMAQDRVLQADGQPIEAWREFHDFIRDRPGEQVTLTIERQGEQREIELTPAPVEVDGEVIGRIGVQAQVPEDLYAELEARTRYGPIESFGNAVGETWKTTGLLLKVLTKMVVGEASVRNVSGPISIAFIAGHAASQGLSEFLFYLALLSISLGVLNLLPIPILDGGHLLYYLIEIVRGAPLSEAAQAVGQRLGIVILLALMGLAFYNDFLRWFATS